jgi:hypothetical protein
LAPTRDLFSISLSLVSNIMKEPDIQWGKTPLSRHHEGKKSYEDR